uniref:Uncharacterized protein n=1 Tax=Nocardia farcinica TaxID=37329 RepID=A0A449G5X0_NOCFR
MSGGSVPTRSTGSALDSIRLCRVCQCRLGSEFGGLAAGGTQQRHQVPQFLERRHAQLPNRAGRVPGVGVGCGDHQGACPHGDQAHLVGDDIMHLASNLRPFPGEHGLGVQPALMVARLLDLQQSLGEFVSCAHQLTEEDRSDGSTCRIGEIGDGIGARQLEERARRRGDETGHRRAPDRQIAIGGQFRQCVERDRRGDDEFGQSQRRNRQHEGEQRPAPPEHETEAGERGDRQFIGIVFDAAEPRVGHREHHQRGIDHPQRRTRARHRQHQSSCRSVSNPAPLGDQRRLDAAGDA